MFNRIRTGAAMAVLLVGRSSTPRAVDGARAMVTVLRAMLGDDPGVQLQLTFFGVTRQWQTFEEAMNEVIEARIHSGIHFRTGDDVGARLGRQVAQFAMTHALRPPKGPWKKVGRAY